jgi:hypothetical protein
MHMATSAGDKAHYTFKQLAADVLTKAPKPLTAQEIWQDGEKLAAPSARREGRRPGLQQVSQIELGFPHDFLTQTRSLVFGDTFPLIDNHRA